MGVVWELCGGCVGTYFFVGEDVGSRAFSSSFPLPFYPFFGAYGEGGGGGGGLCGVAVIKLVRATKRG